MPPSRTTMVFSMIRFCLALFVALFALPHAVAAASATNEARKPNRLINEASPYLRQHADNPIDWYPWGDEAFEKAKKENKPIFLSVGYSTCHWCHVMERESYENEAIAEVLNLNFVAIKVDRERRPDVDETYMLATQLISKSGGWPNNVFLTPDRKPFYGGTYFPPDAFKSLLVQVATFWDRDKSELEEDAARIATAIDTIMTRRLEAAEITPEALKTATTAVLKDLDEFHGGFMDQLKFPQEPLLLFLLRRAEKDDDKDALNAVVLTLDNLLNGGIHDHAGGGFHRYAVDPQWRVPHFEKMLYNQALITRALLRAHRITGSARYANAARRALDYVLADMTAPHGGFYSARDADSGGHEGTFYVWRPEQLEKVLGAEDAKFAQDIFGVSLTGNFEGQTTVLHLTKTPADWAAELKISEAEFTVRLNAVRRTLNEARKTREAPFRDEKSVTAWNGMMIATFAEAAAVLDEARYREAAEKAGRFIWDKVRDSNSLKRTFFEGRPALDGQQEDYAFTALGFVALYDLTGDALWLERAEALAEDMVKRFRDEKAGDFYMTASINTFGKAKARTDSGIPSGNAAALELFALLAQRSRKPDHRLRGEALLAALSGIAIRSPQSNAYSLMAADMLLHGGAGPRQFLAKGTVDAKGKFDPANRLLTVSLRIAPGWHVNSDKPLEDFFIPTRLTVVGAENAAVTYPAAVRRKLGFHDKELALYEGTVLLKARLPEKAGPPVRARLNLQACSDEICLEPQPSNKRVLITRRLTPAVMERAARDYDTVTNDDDHVMDDDEIVEKTQGADAILCCISEKYSEDLISRLPDSVKILSTFSVGTDHIDLEAAKSRGIRVGNTPDAVTVSTAEIAMLLIVGAAHRASEGERMVRARSWAGWEPMQLLGTRLSGKRLGILGLGKIGQAVADRARAFDMEIHYHNRSRLPEGEEQGATYHDTFDSLLSVSDVLSLHAPSTDRTRHAINAEAIAKLPEGAILINTARGDLVVDEDVIAALASGRLAAAGLDVYQGEPAIHEGYYGLENTFLLPHVGTSTIEARNEMGFAALDNIDAVLSGEEPPWPVV